MTTQTKTSVSKKIKSAVKLSKRIVKSPGIKFLLATTSFCAGIATLLFAVWLIQQFPLESVLTGLWEQKIGIGIGLGCSISALLFMKLKK